MVDIEPYQYQKTTNVKEHNDIVAKINEIVDVLNNSGADTLGPRISKLETDVSAIDSAVKIQYQDIASIKDKDQAQDTNIGTLDAQVKGITESLVSDINVIDGTTTGKFKVRLDREKAPSINSNDYDLQKATSIELIQGSGPSMLKAQITLSDGTTLISDDFLFTTEAIGTDVYISSFVFKNGNVAGTISADIGLSNGTTIEANNFVVPMDPSLLNAVQDLSTRLTAVEGGSVAGFKELKTTVDNHTASINALDSDVANLQLDKVDVSQGLNNVGKSLVVGPDGNITTDNVTVKISKLSVTSTLINDSNWVRQNIKVDDVITIGGSSPVTIRPNNSEPTSRNVNGLTIRPYLLVGNTDTGRLMMYVSGIVADGLNTYPIVSGSYNYAQNRFEMEWNNGTLSNEQFYITDFAQINTGYLYKTSELF